MECVECGVWVVLHTVVCVYTWQLKICRFQKTCVNSAKKCAVPGGSNDSKKRDRGKFYTNNPTTFKKEMYNCKRPVKCVTTRCKSSTFINRI